MLLAELLLTSTRDILRDSLVEVNSDQLLVPIRHSVRITDDKRVPSYSGEEFINFYGVVVNNEYEPEETVRKEVYSLNIGITRRLEGIPTDTSAEAIYAKDEAVLSRTKSTMIRRAFQIINLIDGQWGIPALIRQALFAEDFETDPDTDMFNFCILTPLGFTGSAALEEVYAEHFRLEDDGDRPQALFLELSFGGLSAYYNKVGYTG